MYYVIYVFRMSAFFLIAGFFGRMMLERRGMKPFARDRAKRILLPLVVGRPVVEGPRGRVRRKGDLSCRAEG